MVMFGNGAVIGMETIQVLLKLILQVHHQGRIVCFVVVAGSTLCRVADLLFVTRANRVFAPAI